jgi:Glycosyltransferase 61
VSIPFAAVPLLRYAKRLIRGPGTLCSVASEIEELCPQEISSQRQSYYLPDDLTKITGTFHGIQKEHILAEIDIATSVAVTHAAALAFHLKDATIFDGSIYAGNHKIFVTNQRSAGSHSSHFEKAAVVSTEYGSKYFGHWLSDDCLQHQLAANLALEPLALASANYPHKRYYEKYFGQSWSPQGRSRVDHLVVFQDFSQGSLKRARYQVLRTELAKRLTSVNDEGMIYLRRGKIGSPRYIQNESEIEESLSKLGFIIVDSGDPNPEKTLRLMMGAKLLVSMEGSHLMPSIFTMRQNGGIIILQPPDRFNCVFRGIADAIGIRFGFVIGTKDKDGARFDISDIMKVIESIS